MSSPTGFFDVIYLGIFIILSPALDHRFYDTPPLPTLMEEVAYMVSHFHSLLNVFTCRFIIMLQGQPIALSYVVDRMLGKFAAATVNFAKALCDSPDDGEGGDIWYSTIIKNIEGIIQASYPEVFPYFLECLHRDHKDFIWTGPELLIFPCWLHWFDHATYKHGWALRLSRATNISSGHLWSSHQETTSLRG